METQKRLILNASIVISVGRFGHSGDNKVWENTDERTLTKTKEMLIICINDRLTWQTRFLLSIKAAISSPAQNQRLIMYSRPLNWFDT